ncbi:MAG TPA: microcystin degradation protein MlrC, partial [Pelagibacterales bacterium]|nr:microcystin degradation protein MlrC [Pelagibacterales bacterium]
MKNILFIGIFHETNCFIKEKTKLKDFEILKKKEILDLKNDFSQISGFLNFCKTKNLNVFSTVNFTATPSGIVE